MQVFEQQEGGCRRVYWKLPDQGWEDVAGQIDPYLASAIQGIAKEYAPDPVEWLVINHWPDSGRLLVYPAQDGPYGNRGERIYFEISSGYLRNEFARISDLPTDNDVQRELKTLEDTVWGRVGECLRQGQASRRLAEARKIHRFYLAIFNYCFPEGLLRLTELDKLATAIMRELLARLKLRDGGGEGEGCPA